MSIDKDKIVTLKKVEKEEAGMRLDRWFKIHYPEISFVALQKFLRSGQIRLNGRRTKFCIRICPGQAIRIPPFIKSSIISNKNHTDIYDRNVLAQTLLYEDEKIFVFNKPFGLAVQGGPGIVYHIDGMLEAWRNNNGEKPRLVHRIDQDTSGVLLVARTRGAARALATLFRERKVKKYYWSLVYGIPCRKEGEISTWLTKVNFSSHRERIRMCICKHDELGARHAVSRYRIQDFTRHDIAWLEMEPCTGRTHQLRVHALHLGHGILGDTKYFDKDKNMHLPVGIQNCLHLHARRICIPNLSGGVLDISAPLPSHMIQSFKLLGFDETVVDKN